MNELIRKLDLQAIKYADSIPEAGYEVKIWRNHYTTKFAELIVNEVIEIAPHIEGIDTIKQHFGVK